MQTKDEDCKQRTKTVTKDKLQRIINKKRKE